MKHTTMYMVIVLIIVIILAIIFKDKIKSWFKEENYRNIQYAMLYDDAINDQSYLPSIEGCTLFCEKLNNGIYDVSTCMDSCMHTSGFIPRLDMIPNMQDLVENL